MNKRLALLVFALAVPSLLNAEPRASSPEPRQAEQKPKPRARDLGIPFDGSPGPLNAITDVAGVEVGLVTLISGDGKLEVGKGPVRTGVTAICREEKATTTR